MELTQEQESKIEQYVANYADYGLSTAAVDRPRAEAAVSALLAHSKLPPAVFSWAGSPVVGLQIAGKIYAKGNEPSREMLTELANNPQWGCLDANWLSYTDYHITELLKNGDPLMAIYREIVQQCGMYWLLVDEQSGQTSVIMVEKPVKYVFNGDSLHAEDQCAVEWADGNGIVVVNGELKSSLIEAAADTVWSQD